ncbi:1-phosphofructokinase family hexose kinase [Mammaliicoccus stepanovicii]|uniref:Tagatose-6-phosphate kinase n=1 Tax=Mammaliicoccus stepanovicii TaxID=643214 RepID=A0A239YCD2_9STAP|nr:hexose kinase [Mammaliicoccus stepanovicii]PNZ75523.1 tagatose-6-phosphate kinase [Mammaliicoccus stepanovicii]GGI42589.1 tagatose-6-phosphate kinase [Mammaliicoccus stepanovicii]SNV56507.1 tagatose-6-phosphate kinase [Mammaliicoccus stepanovicii]
MILTNTLNPSIDISYQIDNLSIGEVHRPTHIVRNAGGKGINVTKVLQELGSDVTATGYLGGNNGDWIKETLSNRGIETDFVEIRNNTRQCIAINDGSNQTEILEQGPEIYEVEQQRYIHNIKRQINKYSVVTISGSTPNVINNTKTNHLRNILSLLTDSYNILDINARELKPLLESEHHIHAIKPNKSEFEDLIGEVNLSHETIIHSLKNMSMFKGIDVFVTLGSEGAIVKLSDVIYHATISKMSVQNPVGSGDSTVAGIAFGIDSHLDAITLIKTALACGTSNAMQAETGHINLEQVKAFINKVEVKTLS